MGGFVYPNEGEVQWSLLIVIYPFMTGLLAGAWLIPSLYYVFGLKVMRPVARLSLLVGLSFLLVAPVPLQAHLGRPERAFEIFLNPHFTSAMAGFGYIWLLSVLILTAETWLAFRPDIVRYAQETRGPLRPVFWAMALGSMDVSERALAADRTNDYVVAQNLLYRLAQQPLLPEQRVAVSNETAVVSKRLYDAAEKGDAAALNAIQQLRRNPPNR